jgi:hypothetical protein
MNVYGLIAPEGVLGDIRGIVPNPLKRASNENKVRLIRRSQGRYTSGRLPALLNKMSGVPFYSSPIDP